MGLTRPDERVEVPLSGGVPPLRFVPGDPHGPLCGWPASSSGGQCGICDSNPSNVLGILIGWESRSAARARR